MNPQANFLLHKALDYLNSSNLSSADLYLKQALRLQPNNPHILRLLGVIAAQKNDHQEALNYFNSSIKILPKNALTLSNIGNIFLATKNYSMAMENYDKALQLDPKYDEAWSNRGNLLYELAQYEDALKNHHQALSLNPNNSDAWTNAGNALNELKRYEEALVYHEKALTLKSNGCDIWSNKGVTLQRLKRYDEALEHQDKALSLDPSYAKGWYNKAVTLHQLKRCSEAVTCYDQAIALEPENVDAHWNKSLLKLTLGEYAEGWQLYEWRWKTEFQKSTARSYAQPLWLGEQSLENCTILVFAEQGLGDTIQFCRYITLLSDLGAKVILEAPEALLKTLESLQGVNKLIPMGSIPPAFDYYCPLLTLPLAFKTHVATIPNRVPYLKPDPHKAAHWKEVLGTKNRLRVGLVWSGGFRPNQPELWEVNERRNIPLHQLAQLNLPAVDFYSLQKGEEAKATLLSSESSGWNGPKLIDYTDQLVDYSDTAALITNLDLVISVDTSVVHMAGALGKPVWVLNRFDTDWRWFLDRTDSPWYPSATIFHQPNPGDWDSVVVKVKEELKKLTPRVN